MRPSGLAALWLVLLCMGCGRDVPALARLGPDEVVLAFGDSLTFGAGGNDDAGAGGDGGGSAGDDGSPGGIPPNVAGGDGRHGQWQQGQDREQGGRSRGLRSTHERATSGDAWRDWGSK